MAISDDFVYVPNPAHKWGTTEAGPPVWSPDKEKCPDDITIAERGQLLDRSIAKDGAEDNPSRYAIRRSENQIEFYETKLTGTHPNGLMEIHGHPTRRVPPAVLRSMRQEGLLTDADYNKFRKRMT